MQFPIVQLDNFKSLLESSNSQLDNFIFPVYPQCTRGHTVGKEPIFVPATLLSFRIRPVCVNQAPCCSCSTIYLPNKKLVSTVIAFAICPILFLALSISFFDLSYKVRNSLLSIPSIFSSFTLAPPNSFLTIHKLALYDSFKQVTHALKFYIPFSTKHSKYLSVVRKSRTAKHF